MDKPWRFRAGKRPHTVTVCEKVYGGTVRAQIWDSGGNGGKGQHVRRSLGYRVRDRDGKLMPEQVGRAEAYAHDQAAKLARGREDLRAGRATIGQVIGAYLTNRTPRKGAETTRRADGRNAEFWIRQLGSDRNPQDLTVGLWESIVDRRRAGAVDARGRPVKEDDRKPVGDRTLEATCKWLIAVFNWASKWRTSNGVLLLRENPTRGFEVPREKNPSREAITEERHRIMLETAGLVSMEIRWRGRREAQPSYLRSLLIIANGTGRRLSSICRLQYGDLSLERTEDLPHGSITWRKEEDKEGYEWSRIPIDADVRMALNEILAERPGIGKAPIFPCPGDPAKPITKDLASKWFRKAEAIAMEEHGLSPMPKGRTFHGYRARFATETKHLPDKDRAEVGGWKTDLTLRTIYDKPDSRTMLRVVLERGELREAR